MTVPPGINVFKFWCEVGDRFHIALFGTDTFEVVPRCQLNHLLTGVSEHVNKLVTDVVLRVSALLRADIWTPEHGHAYNELIESFCPDPYFLSETDINEKTQIKAEVLGKFETLLMEKLLSYDFEVRMSNLSIPQSSHSVLPTLDNVILQVVLQSQEIFQDPSFGEAYLQQNAPHYHEQLVSFKQSLYRQRSSEMNESKEIKSSKLSKTFKKLSKSVLQKKKRSKTSGMLANSASKSSVMESLLGDIMEKYAVEFYTKIAATPGVQQTEVILSNLKHATHCIELSGISEIPYPSFGSILARINVNIHSSDPSLAGIYCQVANAGTLRIHCELIRNDKYVNRPLLPDNVIDNVYQVRREEYGYTVLLYGYHEQSSEELVHSVAAVGMTSPSMAQLRSKPVNKTEMTFIKWNVQLVSVPGLDTQLHVCHLYPPPLMISSLEEITEQSSYFPCYLGTHQTAPDTKTIEWTDIIKAETKFERLNIKLKTWPGNIITLRFKLDSPLYKCTLKLIKAGGMKDQGRRSNLGINAKSDLGNTKQTVQRNYDKHESMGTVLRSDQEIRGGLENNRTDGLHERNRHDRVGKDSLTNELDELMLLASSAESLFMEDLMETEEMEEHTDEDNIIFSTESKAVKSSSQPWLLQLITVIWTPMKRNPMKKR
ncbi:hypothetical protein WDU94_005888 [Cyamophila willieti]